MAKPVYYIHKAVHQTNEEVEKKVKAFHKAGFKVVIISDGEEQDMSSCLRKMICDNLP